MGRRLSRSISANLGVGRDLQASMGVFSRSSTSMAMSQPKFEANTLMESQAPGTAFRRSASQRVDSAASMRSSTFSARSSFAASPPTTTSKRLLVMSTPQKDSTSKALDVKHFSGLDKPKLVFPSLVMESPTQLDPHMLGQRGRVTERCASFGGQRSFGLDRSPSPVAVYSDVEE